MEQQRAGSHYWQLRILVSSNRIGGVTCSLSGKQQHERWQDMHHLQTGFARLGHEPEGTIAEGLELLERVIRDDLLPRD